MQIDVSIIIPTKNRKEKLNLCLSSIYNSKKKFTFEVIIVDDTSTEPARVDEKIAKVVLNKNNPGPSGARNYGSQIALGKYLFFIDSDVELENETLLKLYDSITTPGIDSVFGMYSTNYPYKSKNFLGEYKNLYWHHKLTTLSKNTHLIHTNIFAIGKDLFKDLNGFNEKVKIGEDLHFGQKLYKNKKYVLLNKKVLFMHNKIFNSFIEFFKYSFINSFFGTFLLSGNKIDKNIPYFEILKLFFSYTISSITAILFIFLLFYFSYSILLFTILAIFIFYVINKRLFYLFYYENGLVFSIKSGIVFFIENLISQIAITFAFLYKLTLNILGKKNEFEG